jgi:UDP-N-acetylmuramate: L-alanyl-gamma-D-glutamyl-meso-diaminopimelate ligase
MPKSHFSIDRVTSLSNVPKRGRIHVIGVSGVAMAQLAVELTKQGFLVSGSDKDFYEPMGSFLRNSSVTLFKGYAAANVPSSVDLVIIGNAVSYENVEVAVVEERNLPYSCFPRMLHEAIIDGKRSIVVTGTHGKSTTTALIASTLLKLEGEPSYFVGGIAQDLPMSLARGDGAYSVVEGDEYDSAFFAKVPKFSFYHPDICVINAIEYDHADIYPDVESIIRVFREMVVKMPPHGTVLCCIDYPYVKNLVDEVRGKIASTIVTFGTSPDADISIVRREQVGLSQRVTARSESHGEFTFSIPMSGVYNAKNALVTIVVAMMGGYSLEKATEAVATFKSVKRRQEVRYDKNGVTLIEDFAHHPTAVHETLSGIREAFPGRKIWGVFEPRSNTSRRKVFQEPYVSAFKNADEVVLCQVVSREIDAHQELLDVATLSAKIGEGGTSSRALPDPKAIEEFLLAQVGANDVIVVMSNGSFGGLPQSLETGLARRLGNSRP